MDVRPVLVEERTELLTFLSTLTSAEWSRPSAAPGWTVKDLALHILDDDLGWLSRGRDRDRSGVLDMSHHESFVQALAAKNQRWVHGAAGLSPRVIIDLLRWAGREMDAYYAALDLLAEGWVSWASDGPVPVWFDIAQDLTERWVHQQQIRQAVGRPEGYADNYLTEVLRTFVWALPHQYSEMAEAGTEVQVTLHPAGVWTLSSNGAGSWSLHERRSARPAAAVEVDGVTAWRWFTGAPYDKQAAIQQGDPTLTAALFLARGIIV